MTPGTPTALIPRFKRYCRAPLASFQDTLTRDLVVRTRRRAEGASVHSPLLRLPGELRNNIYEHCFIPPPIVCDLALAPLYKAQTRMLQLNKQINNELKGYTEDVYKAWQQCAWYVDLDDRSLSASDPDYLANVLDTWTSNMTDEAIANVLHITFQTNAFSQTGNDPLVFTFHYNAVIRIDSAGDPRPYEVEILMSFLPWLGWLNDCLAAVRIMPGVKTRSGQNVGRPWTVAEVGELIRLIAEHMWDIAKGKCCCWILSG